MRSQLPQLLLRVVLERFFSPTGPTKFITVIQLPHRIDKLDKSLLLKHLDCSVQLLIVDFLIADAVDLSAHFAVVLIAINRLVNGVFLLNQSQAMFSGFEAAFLHFGGLDGWVFVFDVGVEGSVRTIRLSAVIRTGEFFANLIILAPMYFLYHCPSNTSYKLLKPKPTPNQKHKNHLIRVKKPCIQLTTSSMGTPTSNFPNECIFTTNLLSILSNLVQISSTSATALSTDPPVLAMILNTDPEMTPILGSQLPKNDFLRTCPSTTPEKYWSGGKWPRVANLASNSLVIHSICSSACTEKKQSRSQVLILSIFPPGILLSAFTFIFVMDAMGMPTNAECVMVAFSRVDQLVPSILCTLPMNSTSVGCFRQGLILILLSNCLTVFPCSATNSSVFFFICCSYSCCCFIFSYCCCLTFNYYCCCFNFNSYYSFIFFSFSANKICCFLISNYYCCLCICFAYYNFYSDGGTETFPCLTTTGLLLGGLGGI